MAVERSDSARLDTPPQCDLLFLLTDVINISLEH